MTDEKRLLLARILAGLQVPLSIGVPLGEADEPYRQILDEGFGWRTVEDFVALLESWEAN